MCGIAGIFSRVRERTPDENVLRQMAQSIVHRGPDGEGLRLRPGYALAHRRLSIVDLGGGAQPMGDSEGRYWVTYNGEVYNFEALRSELQERGHRFKTHCDTEVLLYGYREWGEELPTKLRGMFAFAIVDEREHRMFAARDRIGKKPFYYAEVAGEDVVFGSELKAVVADPRVPRKIDAAALRRYLCLRYVPDPLTIFEGVRKLPPGHRMTVERDGAMRISRYWHLSYAEPRTRSVEEAAEEIRGLLDDAVACRLMGDVPLGAFLSGGVDSFAVVDAMARASSGQVIACSVGFEESKFDERPYARESAAACGAKLYEEQVDDGAMLDQAWFDSTFDEPFADSSAVPTYHVSKLARRHVTVALSGDGGDESFAGYRRYKYDRVENRVRGWAPSFLWSAMGAVYPKADFLPRWVRFKRTFQNLARTPSEAYARSVSAVLPEQVHSVLRPEYRDAADDPLDAIRNAYDASDAPDSLGRAAAADFQTWLPGDILTKVDRASMAVSLEVRAPLLDHLMVEAAAKIPSAMKMAGGETKALLKHALRQRLGDSALNRPKQGFTVPAQAWMAGSIGDALERSLGDERLSSIIDTDAVAKLLREHRASLANHAERLWSVSVLQRFLARWTD